MFTRLSCFCGIWPIIGKGRVRPDRGYAVAQAKPLEARLTWPESRNHDAVEVGSVALNRIAAACRRSAESARSA